MLDPPTAHPPARGAPADDASRRSSPVQIPAPFTDAGVDQLLIRPDAERAREFKYRSAQSAVFGIPVLALEVWGRDLGGPEAGRWVGVLQALLTGWVVYVAAAGMLFEGVLLLSRGRRSSVSADLPVAAGAVGLYVFSLVLAARLLLDARVAAVAGLFDAGGTRPLFHIVVLMLAGWTALRWAQIARRLKQERPCSAR